MFRAIELDLHGITFPHLYLVKYHTGQVTHTYVLHIFKKTYTVVVQQRTIDHHFASILRVCDDKAKYSESMSAADPMTFPKCEKCKNNSVNINPRFITNISENIAKIKKKFGPLIQVTAIEHQWAF